MADEDIDAAVEWLASRDVEYALRWHTELTAAILSLRTQPDRFPMSSDEDLERLGVRELPFGRGRNKYRILFTVTNDTVRVVTVRHASRRPLNVEDLPL